MTASTPQILVVDDDPEIRKLLARYIESQGFRVRLAASCRELREQLTTHQIDLVVLDVMLPDGSGLDMCRDLRAQRSNVPVILLTALKEDVDRIIGLEIGADDYLVKPFGRAELLARIAAVMRRVDRSIGPAGHALTAGSLTLDPGRHEARVGDAELGLTPTEFRLLEALVRAGGSLVPHLQLARAGWPAETDPDLLWLKPHLARLRAKVEAAGGPAIIAVRGVGYRIAADSPA